MPKQNLSEWLKLTTADVQKLKPVVFLKDQYEKNQRLTQEEQLRLTQIVSGLDLAICIKHALNDPLATIFYQNSMSDFWDAKWVACGSIGHVQDAHFEFKKQSTLSSFDLLKGAFLYAKYIMTEDHAYLVRAAELGNFSALNQLCDKCLTQEDKRISFQCATMAAELYLTPGYLLLCTVHCQVGNYYEALRCFILARKLLIESDVFIHNAYRGVDVDAIIAPTYTNWDVGIASLAELSGVPMHDVTGSMYASLDKIKNDILRNVNGAEEQVFRLSP